VFDIGDVGLRSEADLGGVSIHGSRHRPTDVSNPLGPGRTQEADVKYMIMMFSGVGEQMPTRSPEWIQGMGEMLMGLDAELREAGELVAGHGLMDPSHATTVRLVDGVPVPTDGPYAEVKESLAGYWLVETTQERAVEVTARVVGYTGHPMEVRPVMNESQPSDT
jgi:hypothetical protein